MLVVEIYPLVSIVGGKKRGAILLAVRNKFIKSRIFSKIYTPFYFVGGSIILMP